LGEIKKCAMSHLCGGTHPGLSHFFGVLNTAHILLSQGSPWDVLWEGSIECGCVGMLDYSGCSIVLDMIYTQRRNNLRIHFLIVDFKATL